MYAVSREILSSPTLSSFPPVIQTYLRGETGGALVPFNFSIRELQSTVLTKCLRSVSICASPYSSHKGKGTLALQGAGTLTLET